MSVQQASQLLKVYANMPHVWPDQIQSEEKWGRRNKVSWPDKDEYPSLVDMVTDIDFDHAQQLAGYKEFMDRYRILEQDPVRLYFVYKDLMHFKALGGQFTHTITDTIRRRGLVLEILAAYQDILYRDEQLSRYLSFLLRHKDGRKTLEYHGILMDSQGFVDVGLLILKNPRQRLDRILPHQWDPDFWYYVVFSNDKKRFTIKHNENGGISIAAVQGHSIEDIDATGETLINEDNIPCKYVVHATTYEAWEKIRQQGLVPGCRVKVPRGEKPMTRQDVHFATNLPADNTCRISGLRERRPVWIFVETRNLVRNGLEPRLTLNGYVVTRHTVPERIFECILDTNSNPLRDLRVNWRADQRFVELVKPSLEPPRIRTVFIAPEDIPTSALVEQPTMPSTTELVMAAPTAAAPEEREEEKDEPASPLQTGQSTPSEVLFGTSLFPGMSEEERATRIAREEAEQTEEEVKKAEFLIQKLKEVNLEDKTEDDTSFAPMDYTPDWDADDVEMEPPPTSSSSTSQAKRLSLGQQFLPPLLEHSDEEKEDQRPPVRHDIAPKTPPRGPNKISAASVAVKANQDEVQPSGKMSMILPARSKVPPSVEPPLPWRTFHNEEEREDWIKQHPGYAWIRNEGPAQEVRLYDYMGPDGVGGKRIDTIPPKPTRAPPRPSMTSKPAPPKLQIMDHPQTIMMPASKAPFKEPPSQTPPPLPRGDLSPRRVVYKTPPPHKPKEPSHPPPVRLLPAVQVADEGPDFVPLSLAKSKAADEHGPKRTRSLPSVAGHELSHTEHGLPQVPVVRFYLKREDDSDATETKKQRYTRSNSEVQKFIRAKEPTLIESKDKLTIRPALPRNFQHDLTKGALPVIKDPELRQLTAAQVANEKQKEAWFQETLKHLMSNRSNKVRTEQNARQTQANTLQLSFACFNLGNLARAPQVDNNRMPIRLNPMAFLWGCNWGHIVVTLEAGALRGLEQHEAHLPDIVQQTGLKGVITTFGTDGRHPGPPIACHVRGDATAQVVQEWSRRWPPNIEEPWRCVAAQYAIYFGQKSEDHSQVPLLRNDRTGRPLHPEEADEVLSALEDPETRNEFLTVKRAGLSCVRVLAYHIESSKGARTHDNVRDYLTTILKRVASAHVDLVFCDGNLAAHRNKKDQRHVDIPNSTIVTSYRQFQQLINEGQPIERRVQLTVFDNNPASMAEVELTQKERDAYDWDCCLIAMFGWGKTAVQRRDRCELSRDAAHVAKRLGIPEDDVPADTTRLHYETSPKDWTVSMSERALHLDRKDIWLGNNDKDYHRPMFITVRNDATKNFRFRTAEKIKERKDRRLLSQSRSSWHSTASYSAAASWSWRGANAQPEDDLPHEWHWRDILLMILLLIMTLSTLVHIGTGLSFLFRQWNEARERKAIRRKQDAINAILAARPHDPTGFPPPPQPLRTYEFGLCHAETQTESTSVFTPPPPTPSTMVRRRNRNLRKFTGREVVHFSDCVHLQHDFSRSVSVGRLCLICGE